VSPEPAALPAPKKAAAPRSAGALLGFARRNASRRLGAALAIGTFEARSATPLAVLFVATLGRWEGALAMGAVMAVYSGLFFFLLDGENVVREARGWMEEKAWGRYALSVAGRPGWAGRLQRALAAPLTVMFTGPFWRAVALSGVRRAPAYALTVCGSIPHSLLWTGLVLGGIWELALRSRPRIAVKTKRCSLRGEKIKPPRGGLHRGEKDTP
jgi:hypothetical protein